MDSYRNAPYSLGANLCRSCRLRRGGMLRSRIGFLFAVAFGCLLLPAAARAQSSFAGVVKDATGAVLPGVTVEASSPALIEKVRSVTTDANGLYRIENLRPGTYTITFNLPGFSSVKREASSCRATSRRRSTWT